MTNISYGLFLTAYISSDNENGEKSVQQPLQKGPPPSLPSKPPKPGIFH